jgi:hypothetical protein
VAGWLLITSFALGNGLEVSNHGRGGLQSGGSALLQGEMGNGPATQDVGKHLGQGRA